jgi:hypothetical protein
VFFGAFYQWGSTTQKKIQTNQEQIKEDLCASVLVLPTLLFG